MFDLQVYFWRGISLVWSQDGVVQGTEVGADSSDLVGELQILTYDQNHDFLQFIVYCIKAIIIIRNIILGIFVAYRGTYYKPTG